MLSVLLTFENQEQHEEFLQIIAQLTECLDATEDTKSQAELMIKVMSTAATVNPQRSDFVEKHALFIAGQKMTEGSLPELQKLFKREITQHSGSVEVRVYREGKWRPVMQRLGTVKR